MKEKERQSDREVQLTVQANEILGQLDKSNEIYAFIAHQMGESLVLKKDGTWWTVFSADKEFPSIETKIADNDQWDWDVLLMAYLSIDDDDFISLKEAARILKNDLPKLSSLPEKYLKDHWDDVVQDFLDSLSGELERLKQLEIEKETKKILEARTEELVSSLVEALIIVDEINEGKWVTEILVVPNRHERGGLGITSQGWLVSGEMYGHKINDPTIDDLLKAHSTIENKKTPKTRIERLEQFITKLEVALHKVTTTNWLK